MNEQEAERLRCLGERLKADLAQLRVRHSEMENARSYREPLGMLVAWVGKALAGGDITAPREVRELIRSFTLLYPRNRPKDPREEAASELLFVDEFLELLEHELIPDILARTLQNEKGALPLLSSLASMHEYATGGSLLRNPVSSYFADVHDVLEMLERMGRDLLIGAVEGQDGSPLYRILPRGRAVLAAMERISTGAPGEPEATPASERAAGSGASASTAPPPVSQEQQRSDRLSVTPVPSPTGTAHRTKQEKTGTGT